MVRLFQVSQNPASEPTGKRKNLAIAPKSRTNAKPQKRAWSTFQSPRNNADMVQLARSNSAAEIPGNEARQRRVGSRDLRDSCPSFVECSNSILPRLHHLSANPKETRRGSCQVGPRLVPNVSCIGDLPAGSFKERQFRGHRSARGGLALPASHQYLKGRL